MSGASSPTLWRSEPGKEAMTTEYVVLNEASPDADVIKRAGRIIKDGGLVAFPTETVYGLGGDALNPDSSRRIYAAKGRPSDNPLIVHICRFEDMEPIVSEIPPEAEKLAKVFWPGPLTMILRKSELVPKETTGGLDTVAIRFPNNRIAQELIRASGGFIAAPSANRSGRPSPTLAKYCLEDLDGRVEMIIDGGQVGIGLESTIIDLTEEKPVILRPGFINQRMLEEVLGSVDVDRTLITPDSGIAPKAPGMKYRHYAPKGELVILEGERGKVVESINKAAAYNRAHGIRTGVICTDETRESYRADCVKSTGSRGDEASAARELFRILREFDDEDVGRIYSEEFGGKDLGQAIMNRLMKAAGHKVVHLDEGETLHFN